MASLVCRNCGAPYPNGAEFCGKCGCALQPLNSRYQIVEEVATGGVGTVFKAEDIACFNRVVAVKKFTPKSGSSQIRREAEEKCHHEAEILSVLNHHSIPKLYEYFDISNIWYLAMEFIEGATLENRWETARRRTRLSIEEIISIGIELCGVLYYLHQHNIIFTDLKPSNIMLGSDQHVYLIDFGSAHYFQRMQDRRINHMVTQGYAAPELDQGTSSPRSDIYSLGAVLSQLVLGRKPSGSTLPSIKQSRTSPNVPLKLLQLIANMLQENENDRPGNINEVQRELQEIRANLANPVENVESVARGRRTFLIGALAGMLGLAGGTFGTSEWLHFTQKNVVPFPLTIGGKLDDEAALLTEMYVLLLRNAGFEVADKARLGNNEIVFNAIKTGEIDLYPEFLLTGLQHLGIPTTKKQPQDFINVSEGFLQRYQITWLDQAVKLDDNYCVAMPQSSANALHIKTLSDLAQAIKESPTFVFAVAPDGQTNALPSLQATYGIVLSSNNVIQVDEKETFDAVNRNNAQICVCIATDPLLKKDNFVRLADDKNALPIDTPSPIIRNETLYREPHIADILKPLAHLLSVDVSTELQAQMLNGQSAMDAAAGWLKSQGLL